MTWGLGRADYRPGGKPPLCDARGPNKDGTVNVPWVCNRTPGHPGPHRHYDPLTFRIEREWGKAKEKVRKL